MPIYEYSCQACGHALEAIQKFNDPALRECPACHKLELKKQISAGGFQLKGSGWYETDFKGAKKPTGSEPAGGAVSDSAPAPAKKTGGCGSGGCGCH
jgi:putative FmdB family regulatory protein